MKIYEGPRFRRIIWYIFLWSLSTFIFFSNIIHSTSEFQFRTYRDGSEALVLGKIFADIHGIPTKGANLGFIDAKQGPDVLAVYERLANPDAVIPADFSDSHPQHGNGTFASVFLLERAAVAKLGYASDELVPGQTMRFPNGELRSVTKIESSDQFVKVYYSGKRLDGTAIGFPMPIQVVSDKSHIFETYESQYGLQGVIFSWIYRNVGRLASTERLQWLCSGLFALVLVLLCREYNLALANYFGIVFLLCMVGSPWVVSIVRNLYWVTFLWFLPALIAMWLYRSVRSGIRILLYVLFFLAIFLKSLAGYEYLSTIVIFALGVFFIDPFLPKPRYRVSVSLRIAWALFILSIMGFILALLLHASIRADSIIEGLKVTYSLDMLKYNQLSEIVGNVSRGTEMPFWNMLQMYVFSWNTPVVFWILHRLIFAGLIFIAVMSIVFQYATSNIARHRDAALLLVTMCAPVSWFVLMKGHSAIHTHLNYVLWYFGFVPAIIFVGCRGVGLLLRSASTTYTSVLNRSRAQ